MRKSIFILILTILGFSSLAQSDNDILVGPDYRAGQSGMVVKWIPQKLVYPDGFNVYRRSENNENWQKLNESPVKVASKPTDFSQLPTEIQGIYDLVQKASFQELQDNKLIRAFLKLNLYRTQRMAELLGMIWYDENATETIRYQYRISGLIGSEEEELGTTEWITGGQSFMPLPAPDSIVVERLEDVIKIRWSIDESISVATQVEKAAGGRELKAMDELPLYVAFKTDENGDPIYPDYYIIESAHPDTTYSYRFALVDKFGQLGTYSDVFISKPVDLTPPPTPKSPSIVVVDTAMQLSISWGYEALPDDLKGFLIYQRENTEDAPVPISDTLSIENRAVSLKVTRTGDFLITVAAVDDAGNVAESIPLQAKVDDLIAPEVPKEVVVQEQDGLYTISWQPSISVDAIGYFIYRYFGEDKPEDLNGFKIVNGKPLASTVYIDSLGNELKGKLWYAVAAVDSSFNISRISQPASFSIPDNLPPAQPFLKAPEVSEDGILMTWMPNVDDDLENWQLIRHSDDDSLKFTLEPQKTSYLDEAALPGVKYTYTLLARDFTGNYSIPSASISVVAEGVDERIFNGILPSNIELNYSKKDKHIQLSWNQVFNDDNLGVIVYKGESVDDLRPYSGKLRTAGFTDKRIKEETTYFYQLRTYASNGLKKISATKSITIKASDR